MYLIKVEIDRRDASPLLSDCQKMHRFVTGLFGTDRQTAQVLYRSNLVRNKLCLYLYASSSAEHIPANCAVQQREITAWLENMNAGQVWGFDLIASPSQKVRVEGQKNSRRRILQSPADRRAWLERKAAQAGFALLDVEEREQIHVCGRHSTDNGGTMYHDAYQYCGALQITDAAAFRAALQNGIGAGKAYGFGMMLVKRV